MRRRFVDDAIAAAEAAKEPRPEFLLPVKQLGIDYFANWIMTQVSVTAGLPMEGVPKGRTMRVRIPAAQSTRLYAQAEGTEIRCNGTGGTYLEPRVSRLALRIAELAYARTTQRREPAPGFPVFENLAKSAAFGKLHGFMLAYNGLRPSAWFEGPLPTPPPEGRSLEAIFGDREAPPEGTFSLAGIKAKKNTAYEWKSAPTSPTDSAMMRQRAIGWKETKAARGVQTEDKKRRHIIRHGMILMEIPEQRHAELMKMHVDHAFRLVDTARDSAEQRGMYGRSGRT